MAKLVKLLCCVSLLAFFSTNLWAQGIFATLTGVVTDPAASVVPNAKVTLRDVGSGSERQTVANGEGYFTFASVPVGTYNVSVEAQGFQTYKANGIALSGSEKNNLNISLVVGSKSETVEVNAVSTPLVTTDSAEKSFTLNAEELQNLTQVGSDAAEYIKIMPGFGIQNGTSNKANYSGEVIGINANGDAGSQSPLNNAFTYNGLPSNSLDITADGAHVSDPVCNCDTPSNPNSDMVSEFKVMTSNFSAENQKGPAVISSVAKSGGKDFHGSAFFYARNFAMNANDAQFNANGQGRPENKYYYPGFTLRGPVLFPRTRGHPNRKKILLFVVHQHFHH